MKLRNSLFAITLFGGVFCQQPRLRAAVQLADGALPGSQSEESQGDSFAPAISDDGRFITFISLADDLTSDIPDAAPDVFQFDRQTGEMKLISDVDLPLVGLRSDVRLYSVGASGDLVAYGAAAYTPSAGAYHPTTALVIRDLARNTGKLLADGTNVVNSWTPPEVIPVSVADLELARNGSRLFFTPLDMMVKPGDTNQFAALRYYTPATGAMHKVWLPFPVLSGANIPPNLPVDANIQVTSDGRFAVWQLGLTPFSPGQGTRLRSEIMLYDADSDTVTQVSVHDANDTDTFGDSFKPAISDDGQHIVFESRSTNLVANELNGADRNVYLFDTDTRTSTLVNTNLAGAVAAGSVSTAAAISGDGNWTVFFSDAPDLVDDDTNDTGDVFLRNNRTGEVKRVSTQAQWRGLVVRDAIKPIVSSDGEWILYQAPGSGLFLYQRSLDQNTLITTDCEADPASMTPDGSLVAFTAKATTMSPGSATDARNVYVWSRSSGTVELITRRNTSYTRSLPDADTRMTQDGISADGNRFVFRSGAKNLIPNQPDAYEGLWVRDIALKTNIRVAQYDGNDRGTGPRPFSEAVISGYGRYVAYLSQRTNLPPEGLALDGWNDVFVHDLETGVDRLITTSRTGSFNGSSNAFALSISNDGNRVGFLSYATNLTATGGGQPGFYLWDRASNLIRRMDDVGAGNSALVDVRSAVPSPNGTRVAFEARVDGTVGSLYDYLFVRAWDEQQPTQLPLSGITALVWSADNQHLAVIAHNLPYWVDLSDGISIKSPAALDPGTGGIVSNMGISADGSSVFFVVFSDSISPPWQVWNPVTGAVTSPPVSGLTSDISFRNGIAAISADGRYLAFRAGVPVPSTDSYLPPEDRWQVHVWDRVDGTVAIIDRRLVDGWPGDLAPPADLGPVKFAFAPASSRLFFQSTQPDAAPMDANLARDVFHVDFVTQDSDHDGMDDQWEMAYFDTLDRDGSGDADGDGVSDLGEFQAGTIPINSNSVLGVTQLVMSGSNRMAVFWRSVVGKKYIVEKKDSVDATGSAWQVISDVITANRETTFFTDSIGTGNGLTSNGFYRVELVP